MSSIVGCRKRSSLLGMMTDVLAIDYIRPIGPNLLFHWNKLHGHDSRTQTSNDRHFFLLISRGPRAKVPLPASERAGRILRGTMLPENNSQVTMLVAKLN